MRVLCLLLAALLATPAAAQDAPRKKSKPVAKKQQPAGKQGVRGKPTPEQIRRFNELQKKK